MGTHPPSLGSPQVSVVSVVSSNGDAAAAMEANQTTAAATATTSATVPSNLLVTFLEYLSIIMQVGTVINYQGGCAIQYTANFIPLA